MSRQTEAARRTACDTLIISLLRRIHVGQSADAIAEKLGTTPATIRGRLQSLLRIGEVQRIETGRSRDGHPVIVWRIAPTSFASPEAPKPVFAPYTPPRATIVPVRDGGKLAPVTSDGAIVGMGRWTHNPFSPVQELPQ